MIPWFYDSVVLWRKRLTLFFMYDFRPIKCIKLILYCLCVLLQIESISGFGCFLAGVFCWFSHEFVTHRISVSVILFNRQQPTELLYFNALALPTGTFSVEKYWIKLVWFVSQLRSMAGAMPQRAYLSLAVLGFDPLMTAELYKVLNLFSLWL